jgi:HEAT repeat protein
VTGTYHVAGTGVEEQISALEDPDPAIRIEAIDTLAMSSDRRAVWPLISMLVDPVGDVRYAAASALGCMADARATPQLVEVLRHDRGQTIDGCHVKAAAAKALGYIFDEQAIEPLVHALGDRHPQVGEAAAMALSHYGSGIVPFLAEALYSDNTHMRQYALLTLKHVGNLTDNYDVQEHTIGLLRDTSPAVRLQAVEYHRRVRSAGSVWCSFGAGQNRGSSRPEGPRIGKRARSRQRSERAVCEVGCPDRRRMDPERARSRER